MSSDAPASNSNDTSTTKAPPSVVPAKPDASASNSNDTSTTKSPPSVVPAKPDVSAQSPAASAAPAGSVPVDVTKDLSAEFSNPDAHTPSTVAGATRSSNDTTHTPPADLTPPNASPGSSNAPTKTPVATVSPNVSTLISPLKDSAHEATVHAPPVVLKGQLIDILASRFQHDFHAPDGRSDELRLFSEDDEQSLASGQAAYREAARHIAAVGLGTTAVSNAPVDAVALLSSVVGVDSVSAQNVLMSRSAGPINVDLLKDTPPGDRDAIRREYERIQALPATQRDGWALLLYTMECTALTNAKSQGGMVCDEGPVGAGPGKQDGYASERAALVLPTLAFRDSSSRDWAIAMVTGAPLVDDVPSPLAYLEYSHAVARAFLSDACFERVNEVLVAVDELSQRIEQPTQMGSPSDLPHVCLSALMNMLLSCKAELSLSCQRAPLCKASRSPLPLSGTPNGMVTQLYAEAARLRLAGYSIKPILDAISTAETTRSVLAVKFAELPPTAPKELPYGIHVLGSVLNRQRFNKDGNHRLVHSFMSSAAMHHAEQPRDDLVVTGLHYKSQLALAAIERDARSETAESVRVKMQQHVSAMLAATQALVDPGLAMRDDTRFIDRSEALYKTVKHLDYHSLVACAFYAITGGPSTPYATYMNTLRSRDTSYLPMLRQASLAAPVFQVGEVVRYRTQDNPNDTFGGTIVGTEQDNQNRLVYRVQNPFQRGTTTQVYPDQIFNHTRTGVNMHHIR